MACQGTPTATQFATVVQTSFPEHTIVTTEIITLPNAGFRRIRRQDDPNASVGVSATVTDTTTSTTNIFGVDEFSTDIRTITITDTVLVTNTIPQATLYAPCSTTDSATSTPTNTNTNTNTDTASVTSSPSASAIIGASNSTATSPPQNVVSLSDGKGTTTSGSLTLVFSEIITTVNGVRTTTATPIQTILNTSDSVLSDSQRTGVIAGSVGGALVILLALLALVFIFRRRRQSQDRTRMMEEKARRPPRHLLEAEADDDHDEPFAPPMSKWDALSLTTGNGSVVSAPRLLRARGSNTGSLFHENVWPPPSEVMQDPLLTASDLGSSISLVTGIPIDTSSEPQQQHSNLPSRPNSGYMPTAISTGEAVGAVGRQQRSSAYDSVRSMDSVDYYNYNRSHSRAESVEPLLDSAGPAGRTISPPPLSLRNTASSPPPPSFRPGRTNMRISYTAPGLSHARTGTVGSNYSANSMSPGNDSLPGSADTGNSELLRDVLSAGSRAETPQEIPPMYHTIRRDIP